MKRILTVVFFAIFTCLKLYAQYGFMQVGFYASIYADGKYKFRAPNSIEYSETVGKIPKHGTYVIEETSGIPFLNIHWDNNTNERYLMLVNDDFLCLYDRNSGPVFSYYHFHRDEYEEFTEWHFSGIIPYDNITASSHLIEGNIEYHPQNLSSLKINSVWAEGVKGQGIGEKIFIPRRSSTYNFYISIGYVSFTRPDLYKDNSRPKRIRISSGGVEKEFELKDTPNWQFINIDSSEDLIIEIVDVYPGTKYEDTCINNILGLYQGN